MAGEWRATTVGKFAPFSYGKSLPAEKRKPGIIPVVSSSGISGSHDEALVNRRGVVIGRKGTVGSLTYCDRPFWPIDTAFFIADEPEQRDLRFTFYLLRTLNLSDMNSDSAVPGLNRDNAHARHVRIPPLAEQKTIASVLGALDDKIELNRRMNATLERIAQALFQSWFVDFDPVRAKLDGRQPAGLDEATTALFPDSFQDSPLGHIPHGWKVKTLSELTTLITKGTTPTQGDMTVAPDADAQINYVRVNSIDEDGSVLADKLTVIPEFVHAGVLKRSILKSNDVLYTIAGTIGRIALAEDWFLPANTNQAVAIIRPEPTIPSGFLVLTMRHEVFREELHNNIVHAVQANLSLGMLAKARAVVPLESTLQKLFEPIGELLSKIRANRAQSRTLATLRDALLPKLLSGELQIADTEKIAGGSA